MEFLPENYLCFSANRILVADFLQLRDNVVKITPRPPLSESEKKFWFIFSKLFNDDYVGKLKDSSSYKLLYAKEVIEFLRDQAKNFYQKFLNISVAQFLSIPENEIVFFHSFLGLLKSMALEGNDKEPMKKVLF